MPIATVWSRERIRSVVLPERVFAAYNVQPILYYSPSSFGGIADYAHHQANALVDAGADVCMLCAPSYPTGRQEKYSIRPQLMDGRSHRFKRLSQLSFANSILRNIDTLDSVVVDGRYRTVLFGSYAEYLAPLWSGKLRRLQRAGVQFASIVHDPVRNFVVGPRWWHRWSVACGYSFLHHVFLHDSIDLDTAGGARKLSRTVIPIGPYAFPPTEVDRGEFRARLGIPPQAHVLLGFGHIRDGKNLDLAIRALAHAPEFYLIIVGKEQSESQMPASAYQDLAVEVGVADRCRWNIGFIAEEDIGSYFAACDLVLLTYSRDFRSASSVLSAAAHYRKPCLASSGEGNLRSVVQEYQLGIWVEPDNERSVVAGLREYLVRPPQPRWDEYLQQNSWQRNARLVLAGFTTTDDMSCALTPPYCAARQTTMHTANQG